MRVAHIACIVSLLLIIPAQPKASGSGDVACGTSGGWAPSVAASVFGSSREYKGVDAFRAPERLKLSGARIETAPVAVPMEYSGGASRVSWSGRETTVAVLASAILPGLGEFYCYRSSRERATLARVPFFIAVEGALWYGYAHYHSIGKDFKRDYEDYADAHWSLDRFLKNHPCCNQGVGDSCESWQYFDKHCQGQPNYFYYTPKEADLEEYYENIGKYNAFVFGWDDAKGWDYDNPKEFTEYDYWTPHRQYYWSLRRDSDRYLLRAHNCLMGLIVNRIVSMLDAAWISHQMSSGRDPDKGWSLEFKSYNEEPSLMIGCRF